MSNPFIDCHFDSLGPERILVYQSAATGLKAVVVIDTLRFGISAGGVRMAPDLTLEEIVRLARAMTYKYAMIGMPGGGAKGGIWLDPRDPRRADVVAAFVRCVRPLAEKGEFMPFADMGTSASDFTPVGGDTGRSHDFLKETYQGIPLEDQMTGYGVALAARTALESLERSGSTWRVAVEGFGKSGAGAARAIVKEGGTLVAVSTIEQTLYEPEGLDVEKLLALQSEHGDAALTRYPRGTRLAREALFTLPVDVLVPGARPDSIHAGNVAAIRAKVIAPAANIPYADGTIDRLKAAGTVALPDFVTNAGGVIAGITGWRGGSPEDAVENVRQTVPANVRRVLAAARAQGSSEFAAGVRLARTQLELPPT
jgi:glutamate dehydrogenase/leucine dehydrogenase